MATPIPSNHARFSLWEIAAITGGEIVGRVSDDHAAAIGVVTDSRAVVSGNAFVAIRGEAMDGHAFVGEAMQKGAAVAVVERGRVATSDASVVVEVGSTLDALGKLAAAHVEAWRRRKPGARVVAITGSAGKTTTKELLAAILQGVGACHATRGNLNNRVGAPMVAFGLLDQAFAVFELGMSVPGEIEALTRMVLPDVAVLLNIGLAHAEGFGGSRTRIAAEKGAIFTTVTPAQTAIANADDPVATAQLRRARARHVTFGTAAGANVQLVKRECVDDGSRVTIARAHDVSEHDLPVVGEAAAINLTAAIAAADAALGFALPSASISLALSRWSPPKGRGVAYGLEGDILVLDDTYNANPASMRAAMKALADERTRRGRRAICVLGEMRELGPLSAEEHEGLGAELARFGFDLAIGCGGEIDLALRRAERDGARVEKAKSAEEAGEIVSTAARPGDIILFKGSRGATVEVALRALEAKHPPLSRGPA
jgi:UDP-N-acetylmuramoyl-tripeptide--D-alanyl-D-alanine ligase